MKILIKQAGKQVQRMRNIVVVLAMFVCTSICLGDPITISGDIVDQDKVRTLEQQQQQHWPYLELTDLQEQKKQRRLYLELESQLALVKEYSDIAGNGNPNKDDKYKYGKALDGYLWNNPNNNRLFIKPGAKVGNAYGAKMNADSVQAGVSRSMTNNEVIVTGGKFGCGLADGDIAGAWADVDIVDLMNISSNTVIITGGIDIKNVYGGCTEYGTVSSNTVTISNSVTIKEDVLGAWIRDGLASSNTVTITSGTVRNVYGGYIVNNGTAILNKVNLTSVTVRLDVYGAKIGNDEDEDEAAVKKVVGDGLASSNTVTITSGTVGLNVYGGYIVRNGTAILNKVNLTSVTVRMDIYGAKIGNDGDASSNEVTITGGRVGGYVLGGYVYNDGTATGNKVTLTNVDVTRDVYGAKIGTDKKAEFERAEEAMTEAFERVLASLAKFAKDEEADEAELKRVGEATIAEAEIAITAAKTLKDFNSLAEAAAEAEMAEFVRDKETFEEIFSDLVELVEDNEDNLNLNLKDKTERDEFVGDVKEKIEEFKAAKDKLKKYVIAGIERAEAKRARTYVLASSNTVTINGGTVQNVYGGYIVKNGTATENTVTISGGKVKGNVFGGYVGGNGEATHNTINITASIEFSPESILCGGICADADKNDAVTGNTLNIETKGIVVKGISNFEKYKFHLKDIKAGETILTATSGGCSWNTREHNYTSDCAVDISRSNMNISLHTQGVLNKGDQYTLIKSPHGFEGKVKTKQFDFENEGLLIKYYWDIKIADNKQELIAKLIDKKIRDEGVARSLSEGYGAGVVCVNNGMDCIFSKMEETEEQSSKSLLGEGAKLEAKLGAKPKGKGEIGAFGRLTASKSKYDIDKGSHIDMIGTSMIGGVGKVVEVREKELTVGVFAEHGTGESDINCEKKNEGKSSYTGGGLLGRYNIYENEFSGTKLYGEAILRAGQVENKFDSKKMKDSKGKEYKYKYADAMYGGCALGGGYKHKVSEKIDLDWSLRYMFGRQWEKDVKREDADGNRMKFKNITSNRIRIGVRGKYVELEKIKPYAGIGCEYELDGKVKGAIENGVDMIDMPVSDFVGVTGIGELGVSGKVWKFGVDISGQGYLGVRKGFGGMLKLKYAFGKR